MGKSLEDTWQEIANEAIKAAERVDCSMEEFLDGLKDIETAIRERREMG